MSCKEIFDSGREPSRVTRTWRYQRRRSTCLSTMPPAVWNRMRIGASPNPRTVCYDRFSRVLKSSLGKRRSSLGSTAVEQECDAAELVFSLKRRLNRARAYAGALLVALGSLALLTKNRIFIFSSSSISSHMLPSARGREFEFHRLGQYHLPQKKSRRRTCRQMLESEQSTVELLKTLVDHAFYTPLLPLGK